MRSVIAAFYDAYNALGFGFLEVVYSAALTRELERRGHSVQREVLVQIYYKQEPLIRQKLDMVIDDLTIVELKAASHLPQNATRQLYNYLRATDLCDGVLLHFGRKPRFYRLGQG